MNEKYDPYGLISTTSDKEATWTIIIYIIY